MVDNTINGTAFDNPSAVTLYAYLVDGSSNVIAKDTLNNGNGTYSFSNQNGNTAYTVKLSTSNVDVGASAPSSASLPSTWVAVGDAYGTNNGSGSGNESGTPNVSVPVTAALLDITGINFGIERTGSADNKSYAGLNPNLFNTASGNATYPYKAVLSASAGTADGAVNSNSYTVMPGKVSGTDPEDGNYGGSTGSHSSRTIVFTVLPNSANELLAYNDGTQQVLIVSSPTSNDSSFKYWNAANSRYEIASFNDSNLSIFIKNNGHTSFSFNYAWMDAANQLGSAASFGVQGYGPLPVTWLSVSATWNGNDAKLQWSTAAEINNDRFEIERSFDNKTFEKLGQKESKNNGNTNYYIFDDIGAKEMNKEVLYYRIKQIDKNGEYSYSNVQILNTQHKNNNAEINVSVYPNPVGESASIKITGSSNSQVSCTISDIDGKLIRTEIVITSVGNETIKIIDMTNLAKGVYLLNVKGNNFNQTIRLVKIDK